MSRLIDADKFEEFLWNNMDFMVPKGTEKLDQYEIKKLIDAQPTAYDVEKVVAELEELKQHNKELSEGAYLEDDKSFYFCAYTNFARAIGIVRKGGVE